jgi:hypothetical protein
MTTGQTQQARAESALAAARVAVLTSDAERLAAEATEAQALADRAWRRAGRANRSVTAAAPGR